MESIFDELDKKTIANQNFPLAIACCIAEILFSYASAVLKTYHESSFLYQFTFVLDLCTDICVWAFFRKYLQNFRAARAENLVKWYIAISIIIMVLFAVFFIMAGAGQMAGRHSVALMISFLMFFGLVADLCITIGIGISLQKIENDFIGLLRTLGLVLVYVIPFLVFLSIMTYSEAVKRMFGGSMVYVHLFYTTISAMPTLLFMAIFYRAMKYPQKQDMA